MLLLCCVLDMNCSECTLDHIQQKNVELLENYWIYDDSSIIEGNQVTCKENQAIKYITVPNSKCDNLVLKHGTTGCKMPKSFCPTSCNTEWITKRLEKSEVKPYIVHIFRSMNKNELVTYVVLCVLCAFKHF